MVGESEEIEAITEVEDLEPVDITIVSKILGNLVESILDTTVRVVYCTMDYKEAFAQLLSLYCK